VSKRRDRPYRGGRSPDWVKVKNRKHPAMERVIEASRQNVPIYLHRNIRFVHHTRPHRALSLEEAMELCRRMKVPAENAVILGTPSQSLLVGYALVYAIQFQ
jgi:hypothetical protein